MNIIKSNESSMDIFGQGQETVRPDGKEEEKDEQEGEAVNMEKQEKAQQETQTIEVAEDGSVTVEQETRFKKEFGSRKEAANMLDLLDGLGYEEHYELTPDGKGIILKGLTERDVAIIQRKCNIKLWSDRTQAVANAVTNFATDVADYALNGALAPTAGAVINAGMTTGRVVGTAAVSIGAATLATTIRNGRAAARELKRNKDVKDAWSEVKGLGSDIGSFIFGGEKQGNKNSWTAC